MTWYAVGRPGKTAAVLGDEGWFHGTTASFERFDLTRNREAAEGSKHWNSHLGAHFTSEHSTAAQIAQENGGGHVYHCSLGMTWPKHYISEFDLDREARHWAEHGGHGYDSEHRDSADWLRYHPDIKQVANDFREHLKRQGHDGITYGNEYEGSHLHECAIAFHPDDITIEHRHAPHEECEVSAPCPNCGAPRDKDDYSFEAEGCHWCGWGTKVGVLTQHFASEAPRLWPSHPEYRAGDRVMERTPNGKQHPATVHSVDEPTDPDHPGRVWIRDDERDRGESGVHPSRLSPHPDASPEQVAWHEQQKAKNAAGEPYVPEAERHIDENDRTTVRHLTDRHDFALDPTRRVHNNTTLGGDLSPRLFVGDPEHWANSIDYGYRRPYVAEIDVPKDAVRWGGYGGEGVIPGRHFDKARVTRVLPYSEYEREGSEPGYRSTVDARSWTPEQHTEHLKHWRNYLHEEHGWGWNEFNEQHEHVGLSEDDWDEHMRDPNHGHPGTYVRRDREGKPMIQPRSMLTQHFAAKDDDIDDIMDLLGPGVPKAPEKTQEQKAQEEAERQERIRKHREWQAKRPGANPGDDLDEVYGGHMGVNTSEWVPIGVAQRFRDHYGHQHSGSPKVVEDLTQQLKSGRGMTDPLMLLHHNEASVAHLGEGNHRLKAAENAGWTHVPMRVVRMYDGETNETNHSGFPYQHIPLAWRGTHAGRTPDMCKPSEVFSPEALSPPPPSRKQAHLSDSADFTWEPSYSGGLRGGSHVAAHHQDRVEGHPRGGPGVGHPGDDRRHPGAPGRRLRAHPARAGGARPRLGLRRVAADDLRPLTWHPKAKKEVSRLDKPSQKSVHQTIEGLRRGDENVQTHALTQSLKGWHATKASRGHRIVHQPTDDGGIFIGAISLHDYGEAIRRLTVREQPSIKVKVGEPKPAFGQHEIVEPRLEGRGRFSDDKERWEQDHESLLADALHSWRGWPGDMERHLRRISRGEPPESPSSGGYKIHRAQAEALHQELQKAVPIPRTLYRGSHLDDLHPHIPTSWSEDRKVARHWADKGGGEVKTLKAGEARGIEVAEVLGHDPERQWLVVAHPEQREAGLDLDGYISVAEEVMERAGHEGSHWDLPKGREGDPEYYAAKRPVEDFVNDVLKPYGNEQWIKVHPDHWDLRHGGQGVTDGYNFIGVKAHTTDHTLLHECAHIINRSREGAGHDVAFAHTLRHLYEKHISPEAAQTFWDVASGHPDLRE